MKSMIALLAPSRRVSSSGPVAALRHPIKSTRNADPKHPHQVHQRPLQEHVVLEKVELEHEFRLGSLRGAVDIGVFYWGCCGVVPVGEEGEFPPETARDLGEAV